MYLVINLWIILECKEKKNLQISAIPRADAVEWRLSMHAAGNSKSEETKDKTKKVEMQSALSPWNDPYRNNCTLGMHELQRISLEGTVN